jgi:hypothetical protein
VTCEICGQREAVIERPIPWLSGIRHGGLCMYCDPRTMLAAWLGMRIDDEVTAQ